MALPFVNIAGMTVDCGLSFILLLIPTAVVAMLISLYRAGRLPRAYKRRRRAERRAYRARTR